MRQSAFSGQRAPGKIGAHDATPSASHGARQPLRWKRAGGWRCACRCAAVAAVIATVTGPRCGSAQRGGGQRRTDAGPAGGDRDEEEDAAICALSAAELQARLRDGRLSASRVLEAYQRAAISATNAYNCVTEFVESAADEAALRDAARDATAAASSAVPAAASATATAGESAAMEVGAASRAAPSTPPTEPPCLGLLHGMPISIKDCCDICGMDSTIGTAKRCFRPAEEDSVIVQVLRHEGAVPFCKTNVPQTMLSFDASNPIFGRTRNPRDPTRIPGGSSSGEAALIAAGASLFGIGTDIAGSTRVPPAFCGVCGLKPTLGRVSMRGFVSSIPGQTGVAASAGPMARDVDALILLSRALFSRRMWELDPHVVPLPFQEHLLRSHEPLRIGYFVSDGFFEPVPAVQRAVRVATAALQRMPGCPYEVMPFHVPWLAEAVYLYYELILADSWSSVLHGSLAGEPVDPCIRATVAAVTRSRLHHWLLAVAFRCAGWTRMARVARDGLRRRSVADYYRLVAARRAMQQRFARAMQAAGIDAIICPVAGLTPLPPGYAGSLTCMASYCMLFNLLDYPAGVLPVTVRRLPERVPARVGTRR